MEQAKRRLMDLLASQVMDEPVIAAMSRVPREAFVPESRRHAAYEDNPAPIGEGQTISQPFVVALMISALELRQSDRVLEVGTGSGYQAAVLAELAREVITVERIKSLADSARERLVLLGYKNIQVRLAEQRLGWQREAPYNAVIVAAGAPKLPQELIDQLADAGRLVMPVGSPESQELMKLTNSGDSRAVENLGRCRFVPLIGEGAWDEDEASVWV